MATPNPLFERTRTGIAYMSLNLNSISTTPIVISEKSVATSAGQPESPKLEKLSESSPVGHISSVSNFSIPQRGSDEELWAAALVEVEGATRRPGLWARVFSEANGDTSIAKATYLRIRVSELEAEAEAAKQLAELLAAKKIEEQRAADQRAFDALPLSIKGKCPNCDAILLLSAEECASCKASFDEKASWGPKPLVSGT